MGCFCPANGVGSPLLRLPGTRQFAAEAPPTRRWRTDDYGVPNTGKHSAVTSAFTGRSPPNPTCGELVPCQATEDPQRPPVEKPQALGLIQQKTGPSHKLCIYIPTYWTLPRDRPEKRKVTGLLVNRRNQFPILRTFLYHGSLRDWACVSTNISQIDDHFHICFVVLCRLSRETSCHSCHTLAIFFPFCFWVRNEMLSAIAWVEACQ